jgi:hypothetical protein
MLMVLIFSPNNTKENMTMMKMQAPEKIGYAMFNRMYLRAFVKKKTFSPCKRSQDIPV